MLERRRNNSWRREKTSANETIMHARLGFQLEGFSIRLDRSECNSVQTDGTGGKRRGVVEGGGWGDSGGGGGWDGGCGGG